MTPGESMSPLIVLKLIPPFSCKKAKNLESSPCVPDVAIILSAGFYFFGLLGSFKQRLAMAIGDAHDQFANGPDVSLWLRLSWLFRKLSWSFE
jgi:hypothetical protein